MQFPLPKVRHATVTRAFVKTDLAPIYGSAIRDIKRGGILRRCQVRWVNRNDVRRQIQFINKLSELSA